jgi:hypothetical protein
MTAEENTPKTKKAKRPFFLSFLCIIGFSYTSLFSILFVFGMLYATGISGIMNKYLQLYDLSRLNFFLFSISGFLIFFSAFMGVLLMWKLQKLGFYIYAFSSLLFLLMEFSLEGIYLPDIIIHLIFIILFMIAFPFKKSRRIISEA